MLCNAELLQLIMQTPLDGIVVSYKKGKMVMSCLLLFLAKLTNAFCVLSLSGLVRYKVTFELTLSVLQNHINFTPYKEL